MKQKLIHPLWVHLPALAVLLGAFATANWGGPTWLSIHKYGAKAQRGLGDDVILILLMGLACIALSAYGDELWARQETRKRFNWLSLIDEALVGFLASTLVASAMQFPLWALPVGAVALAVILELMRPYRPFEQRIVHEDTSAIERHIQKSKLEGKAWVYWDVQNPVWMIIIAVGCGTGMVCVGVAALRQTPWLAGVLVAIGLFLFGLIGGMRTSLTSERIEVRMGLFKMLTIPLADVASADAHTFSPLREYGGYGIRYGHGVKAFYFSGNRGVMITTKRGKKYLIGSDHADRLAAAIAAARA